MRKRARRLNLGVLEMRVMKEVWRRGRSTVHQVRDSLPGRRCPAYTTILTTLRNLERKGFLRHEVEGRSHVYIPTVDERDVERSNLRDMLDRLFDGSRVRLVHALFDREKLTRREFERLWRKVQALRKEEHKRE